ncbi:DUF4325 domain-containing protein [candidate division WOR-1 bacterium RIFOXYB2_FULL_42_35]|uniref:DUF4325 domain-containing protein n=1 Tax=candidate division WOR-1 bacterium RIFOXYC2_FULL_41_25 TaxID=1802586 RepID=A0A1F4TMR1_UNCSA|nr:MAG: DUF4325 domain-containing protein [candidate division WOR-1 bacterium RIFOXYA2_FULL_41_14]OGC24123.1 MAG: DUF4325 domain-containing protein [candidate division WOR-1 bacterium RIFOXYB2_FULL_42_35]OGC33810.1 MAG: DUF4325 domain-containing protein [candidate division WOR-1 bacterium RIFOXYC2_FULL_41_25]OGC43703.1 MAG: DUF4325 domain-containing protein [candidate division WOR-1 bacterium RIFOXYD2_FULL_41_8]
MIIQIKKFGKILLSRPAGRDAFLSAKAYLLPQLSQEEEIVPDFSGVDVLAPSWADEFISGLKEFYGKKPHFLNTTNASVALTLETVVRS